MSHGGDRDPRTTADGRRLRFGEICAAAGAVALLLALLVLHWSQATVVPGGPRRIYTYRLSAPFGPLTGWQALPALRWLALATIILGLALAIAQATAPGPALPVSLDLITVPVAGAATVALVVQEASSPAPLRFGAVLGLLGAGAVCVGAFRAMRAEQGWIPGVDREVPLVILPGHGAGRSPADV